MNLILLLSIPVGAIAAFIISLVQFLKTDKSDTQLREEYKVYLIISSCILGVVGLAIVILVIVAMFAVSHM